MTTQSLPAVVTAVPSGRERMSWRRCKSLIASDLYRYNGVISARQFWRHFLFTPGFRYSVALRLATLLAPAALGALRLQAVHGLDAVPLLGALRHFDFFADPRGRRDSTSDISAAFDVNDGAVIGNNCNIQQDVTLGKANRGKKVGAPVIGNNVFIGAGAKIIGRIHVGDGAAVGANAVVTKDVPAGAAVAGVPARVVSEQGSEGYVNRTDYPPIRD